MTQALMTQALMTQALMIQALMIQALAAQRKPGAVPPRFCDHGAVTRLCVI